uniref:Uncharacterized protein n=1 Tax=Setaria digitata TaxID=48799 RepID=A0A915PHJ0_9BILA
MFFFVVLFLTLSLLYVIYDILGRKLTIKEIDKKAVLITGCGSGFGRGLVKRCLQNGLTVFAGCEFESDVKDLVESYRSISQNRLYAFQMNVTDDDSVRKSREHVDEILHNKNLVLHALINNAGIQGNLFYDDFLNLDDYKEVWNVNVLGVIRVTHKFQDLIKQSRGRIVICSSGSTMFASPSTGPYASSKQGVQAYAIIIRHELQPYGIYVIEVAPSSFQTGMLDLGKLLKMMDKVWYRASQEMRDEFGEDYNEKAKVFVKEVLPKLMRKDITWVIDAYYEAIVAKRPKLLYRVGWHSLLSYYPYSLLPVRLQLLIMNLLMLAHKSPLPATTRKSAVLENVEYKID